MGPEIETVLGPEMATSVHEMVYYKRVRSLRGRIKGVKGWERGSWRGRIRGVEVGGGGWGTGTGAL